MKKNRIAVLEKNNWKCTKCGGKATEVHHIDGSKDNHDEENLLPVCRKCHMNFHRVGVGRPTWNVDIIETALMHLGMDKKELAEKCGIKTATLYNILRTGRTKNSTMKKIADALGYPIERFISNGTARSQSDDSVMTKLDSAIEDAVSARIGEVTELEKKELHRRFRYWLTSEIRDELGLKSWTDVKESNLQKALDLVEQWKQKYSRVSSNLGSTGTDGRS